MASKFESLIRKYCYANGITIPVGFGRNTPSRYSIVLLDSPPKLVAATWSKLADVAYFVEGHAQRNRVPAVGSHLRILDFKDLTELSYLGKARFGKGPSFRIPD